MPQDAYTIKFISEELSSLLTGGKISKIAQPDKDTLTFIIYTRKGSVKLETCLSAKYCRINISDSELVAPKVAPAFCMLLRKYLQNAQITAVSQIAFERIVYIDFDCTSEFELTKMRLYIELMGKYSNAVLTKDGIITGALKTTALTDNVKRILFSGARYALPEKQDKISPDDVSALELAMNNVSGDAAAYISDRVRGVSYSTALDIVRLYGEKPTGKEVNSYICGGQFAPCVEYGDGVPADFKARSESPSRKEYDSILEAQTAYYGYVLGKRDFADAKRRLESALRSAIKKHEKRLAAANDKLAECSDMDKVKLKGELLTANIYAVPRGADSFEAVNYYDEAGGKIKIQLDKSLSPADNAQRLYKRYAKLKRTFTAVSAQKQETERELDYLSSIQSHICTAEKLSDLDETEDELRLLGIIKSTGAKPKKPTPATPFRSFIFDGFVISAGRNNISNDRLLKSAAPDDIWLHTQRYHSAHVVIATGGKLVPDAVMEIAAQICAFYSDGRQGSKVPVDYCARKFVKKPPKSNAGFVVYTDYKTILVKPDSHTELSSDI